MKKRGIILVLFMLVCSCIYGCENGKKVEHKKEYKHIHYYEFTEQFVSCTESRIRNYKCDCGDTYNEEIKAKGHSYGYLVYNDDVTSASGGTKTAKCQICGYEENADVRIPYVSVYDVVISEEQYVKFSRRINPSLIRAVEREIPNATPNEKVLRCAWYSSLDTEEILKEELGVTLAPSVE